MQKVCRFFIPVLLLLLFSCGGDRLDVDVSSVKVEEVKIMRLEKDLFSLDTNRIEELSPALQKKYNGFFEKFVTSVINDGGMNDSTYGESLRRFLGNSDMREVYNTALSIYTDAEIAALETQLTDAFRHIRYYFPDTALPAQVVTMISGFNYGIVNVDSTLAASLDFYLGPDAKFYNMMATPLPSYKKRMMKKEYLPVDLIAGWVAYKFDRNEPEKNLLEVMIKTGKLWYCTRAFLPSTEDSVLVGYTEKQMQYCDDYENKIWGYFSENNRLYTNNLKDIVAYTTDGPFTAAISKDCPPAIAKYIGYRIVSSYMENNPDVTLAGLMAEQDPQKILSKARYKPKGK